MSKKPISPLRQRMIDDMTARRFKEKVQKDYVRHVRTFAAFLGRSPDTATSEDLRRYQLHMVQQQRVSPHTLAALPGPDPIGANIAGPCIGKRVFVVAARVDVGAAPQSSLAGERGWARA